MKKFVKLILINLCAVLLVIVIFEIIIRLLFPQIILSGTSATLLKERVYLDSPGLKPNSQGESYGVMKEVDSLGFWKYNNNKTNHKINLLLLGDSATMGIGVENDSTFAGLINSSVDSVKIFNPSLIGYSSKDYLNIINKVLVTDKNKLHIKKLMIFWCLNDVYDNYPTKDSPDIRTKGYVGKFINLVSRNFKTWHLLKELFSDRQKDYFQYDVQFYEGNNLPLEQSLQNIIDCYSIAKKFDIDTEFIILPYEYQIRNIASDKYNLPQATLEKKLSDYEINTTDILDMVGKDIKDSKELFLFGDGIHFSKVGHRLIAKLLLEQKVYLNHIQGNAHR